MLTPDLSDLYYVLVMVQRIINLCIHNFLKKIYSWFQYKLLKKWKMILVWSVWSDDYNKWEESHLVAHRSRATTLTRFVAVSYRREQVLVHVFINVK